jgi:biopolymer transport protein ExbD
MEEINPKTSGSKNIITPKSKKQSTKVDLTPMVDLGFLLITFFMFATTLAQPTVAKFRMPNDDGPPTMPVPRPNTIIIIADSTNKYFTYEPLTDVINLKKCSSIEDVRKNILTKKKGIKAGIISVILKIHPDATYNNLIEMLDEMTINAIEFHVKDKLNAKELSLIRNFSNLQ